MIRTWLRQWLGIEALDRQVNKTPPNPFLAMQPTWPLWDRNEVPGPVSLVTSDTATVLWQATPLVEEGALIQKPATATVSEPPVFEPHMGRM